MNMQIGNVKSVFDVGVEHITKPKLVLYVTNALKKNGEIAWFATESRSFEWAEINLHKEKFLKDLQILKFKKVHIGIFYPETKETEYRSFQLK